jgi:hypothetical protein
MLPHAATKGARMNTVAIENRGVDGIRIGDFIAPTYTSRLLRRHDHIRVAIAITTTARYRNRVLRTLTHVSNSARAK